MLVNIPSHPAREGQPFSSGSVPNELFQLVDQFVYVLAHLDTALYSSVDFVEDAFVVTFSEKDFCNGEFFDDRIWISIDVGAEVELLGANGVSEVCPVEVLPDLGDGNVEVEIVVFVEYSGDEVDEDAVGCIFIGG